MIYLRDPKNHASDELVSNISDSTATIITITSFIFLPVKLVTPRKQIKMISSVN